ncbi:restriction endonuclease subunit S [Mycoplasma bradburyae]|nr:restriction endonuclease subunit S [Mycoplasma bradburyae]UTS70466.1 restriction endonuclease subunit S [Mycoplasma bradburyae]
MLRKFELRELIKIKNGKDYKEVVGGSIPVYGTGGIIKYTDSYLSDKESILLPRIGSLKNILYVNHKFWTANTMYWTEVNKEFANVKYLYYYLKLLNLSPRNTGSTLPKMTFDTYYDLEVWLPSIDEQEKRIKIINQIDLKIQKNNEINDNLENDFLINRCLTVH